MNAPSRGTLLVLAGAVLVACGDRGDGRGRVTGGETPERGGTAVIAELADMSKPMPIVLETSLDADLQDIMYMALLRGAWRDGRLVYLTAGENPMALARSYEYLPPDSTALRYHLRTDVRWSDGEPVTPDDVVWTYQTLADPATAAPRQDYTEHIDSVVAGEGSTVTFYFDRRYPEMLFHSGHGIAPEHVFADADPSRLRSHQTLTDPGDGKLVVNGSFQVARWDKGQRIVLEPNLYFRPRPYLERIVIRVIPEETTRLVELQTGNLDFMRPVPFDKIDALRAANPELSFETEERRFYDYIGYNPNALDAFADPEMRRAFGLAIDKPGIIDALQMEEFAEPAGGPYSPIFRELYDPDAHAPLAYDTAAANRVLDAKGWRDTDGDGVREKDGRELSFTLVTNAGNQRRIDVGQILQQQLRRVGVEVELRTLETNTFYDRLTNKEFEAALAGWGVGLSPDLTNLWGPEVAFNFISYENPEVTRLFQQAVAQPTEERANRYWRAAAARMVEDQPYTWLYYFDQVDAVSERLRGMKVDTYGAFQNAWEWWIPRGLQRRAGEAEASPDTAAEGQTG
ncbi:MAG: ABC transporter substrate-binding protein [Longimicrobiaceae bacterium]